MTEKLSPFAFVGDITTDKKYIMTAENNAEYVPFLANKALSFTTDSVYLANLMNEYHEASNKMQYDFYFFSVRKKPRRYTKWPKKTEKNLNMIKRLYNVNEKRADEIDSLLTPEQKSALRNIEESLENVARRSEENT